MRNRDRQAMPLPSVQGMHNGACGLTKLEAASIAAMQGILACPAGWAAATEVVKATDARVSTEMAVAHFSIEHANALFDEMDRVPEPEPVPEQCELCGGIPDSCAGCIDDCPYGGPA